MQKDQEKKQHLIKMYGSEKEGKFAQKWINQINEDLELREKSTLVSNGIPYSQAYEYNQKKAINYSPAKSKDDRQVSVGLVHEKIISFCAIFLKYVFKRRIKCYDEDGNLIRGMGKVYDLAIEYSHEMEQFKKKLALIYWETFTQGNSFVLEDWEVKLHENPEAYDKDGKKVDPEKMDYTFEYLDSLTYKKGKQFQTRRAVSRVLDGRQVIFGNPEVEEVQEQPRITIEVEYTKADAEMLFGSLKRWKNVPKNREDITAMVGEKTTLFDASRHKKPEDIFITHYSWDKENNLYNIFVNGMMILPRDTPMSVFYPRVNYPLSNVPAERLRGSIYSRSIPAKTKFNADFVDWVLKMMANKFEQGIDPAILTKGKYTLTRQMFRGGQVTHGVSREDFEKADPENKGVTNPEFNFFGLVKEIVESQTVNQSFSGEVSNATATEIATVDSNQQKKLAYLLDGLMGGFLDMYLRRAETIESKYTIKQKETVVDGKKISVYQNFSVNVSGIENVVNFDEQVGTAGYDEESKKDELFKKAFQDKKNGFASEYYLVNPKHLREKKYNLIIEVLPEQLKDSQLQMIQLFDEFGKIIELFGRDTEGGAVSTDELKKEYLEVSGRPDELFTSKMYEMLDKREQASGAGGMEDPSGYDQGSFGKPTVKSATQQLANNQQ